MVWIVIVWFFQESLSTVSGEPEAQHTFGDGGGVEDAGSGVAEQAVVSSSVPSIRAGLIDNKFARGLLVIFDP